MFSKKKLIVRMECGENDEDVTYSLTVHEIRRNKKSRCVYWECVRTQPRHDAHGLSHFVGMVRMLLVLGYDIRMQLGEILYGRVSFSIKDGFPLVDRASFEKIEKA